MNLELTLSKILTVIGMMMTFDDFNDILFLWFIEC